jgi:hypothetical protein
VTTTTTTVDLTIPSYELLQDGETVIIISGEAVRLAASSSKAGIASNNTEATYWQSKKEIHNMQLATFRIRSFIFGRNSSLWS